MTKKIMTKEEVKDIQLYYKNVYNIAKNIVEENSFLIQMKIDEIKIKQDIQRDSIDILRDRVNELEITLSKKSLYKKLFMFIILILIIGIIIR